MKFSIFAFSLRGLDTAGKIRQALGSGNAVRIFTPERLASGDAEAFVPPVPEFVGPLFRESDGLVFVGACGIAVRAVAPHVKSKLTDPAVIAVDELGRFVIPLLSGHIGGANALAVQLANALGAEAAVTTATDINGRFSADAWAAERGLFIDDLKAAKAVSSAILEENVPMVCDFPVIGELPAGVVPGDSGPVGFCVSWKVNRPFETTLLLVPKVVRIGIGCRRGTSWSIIRDAVEAVLGGNQIHPEAVKCVGSIDLKRDEAGLLAYCQKKGWPVHFYPAARLKAVEGDFTPSDFVEKTTGVDNVCERAAALGGGTLIVRKTALNGVTVAAAVDHWEVRFE